jgi:hypothetical protein
MRLLALEQRAVEDLARWYGPDGRTYRAAARAVSAWLMRLREQLQAGQVGPEWALCEQRPARRLEGCWRVHFSPRDQSKQSTAVIPAPGPRGGRIVAEVVMHDGQPAIRVLAIGPKYAGRGPGEQEWVYRQADRRRRHAYEQPTGGGS